jgi:hypothetical protein
MVGNSFHSALQKNNQSRGGESMNRKTLSVAFTLVLVVMVSASVIGPAQACRFYRRKKIPVTITRGPPMTFGEIETCTKGNRYFAKAESAFGTYIVEGGGIRLEKQDGPLSTTYYVINQETGKGIATSFGNLNFGGGTFKGIIITRGVFVFGIMPFGLPFPSDVTQKGVWHGDGDYAGWTLVLEFTTGDDPVEGYLLVPR